MVGCETSDVQGLYDPKKYDVMTVYWDVKVYWGTTVLKTQTISL